MSSFLKNKMKWTIAALVFLAGIQAYAHHAWTLSGYSLHWPRVHKGPVNLELVDLTGVSVYNWSPHTREAANDWSKARNVNVNYNRANRRGTGPNTAITYDAVIENCSYNSQCIGMMANNYGGTGWLGIGGGWIEYDPDTDQLHWILGVAVMNDFYYETEPYASFYGNYNWRQTVVCQEIGHALGLGHIDEDFSTNIPSCMDYALDPYPHPFAHDYEVLNAIHSHVEDFEPPAAPPIAPPGLDDSSSWGDLIDSKGPVSTYVLDMGDNQYWITHVTWAED